jgi:histone-lysine N-methyltransferase SETD2
VRSLQLGDDLNEKPRSRKSGCPFELIGYRDRKTHIWRLRVECGRHNHDLSTSLEGYPYADRMNEEQKEDAKQLTLATIEPREAMIFLKNKWPEMTTSMKQLYDFRHEVVKKEMSSMTVTQFSLHYLKSNGYYVDYRTLPGSDKILDLFFAHPKSLDLLKLFPYVVIMDSTYQTNM